MHTFNCEHRDVHKMCVYRAPLVSASQKKRAQIAQETCRVSRSHTNIILSVEHWPIFFLYICIQGYTTTFAIIEEMSQLDDPIMRKADNTILDSVGDDVRDAIKAAMRDRMDAWLRDFIRESSNRGNESEQVSAMYTYLRENPHRNVLSIPTSVMMSDLVTYV